MRISGNEPSSELLKGTIFDKVIRQIQYMISWGQTKESEYLVDQTNQFLAFFFQSLICEISKILLFFFLYRRADMHL